MICPNCGKDNPAKAKFCENCGTALSGKKIRKTPVKTLHLKCKNCDGIMTVDEKNHVLVCPFCGSKELILDSEDVAVEKARAAFEKERAAREKAQSERDEEQKDAHSFRRSIFRRVLIAFVILDLLFIFTSFTNYSVL